MARPYHFRWSNENRKLAKTAKKLGKSIVSFNLTALKMCPYAGACAQICYAQQGAYRFPNAVRVREHNDEKLLLYYRNAWDPFDAICEDISRKRCGIVRIHDSGDFFSRPYLIMWVRVARAFPKIIFYAYTKSIPLLRDVWNLVPSNMRITQSVGGKRDRDIDFSKPHAVIFNSLKELRAAGYVNGSDSDIPAIRGKHKIGLIMHSQRTPTPETLVGLRVRK